MDAKPPARHYRWQYNSSQGSFQIPNAKSMMSFMNYAVSEEGGEGEVLCWATNELGEQSEPCVFHVVPLGVPHTPHHCEVVENTETRVRVGCSPGYGGGEPQHFVLSLLDMVGGVQTAVQTNWSSQPDLSLTELSAGQPRLLSVHSANSQGKSDPVYLATDIPTPTRHEGEQTQSRQSVLYIIVSVLASIMGLSLLLSLTHFCRRRRRAGVELESDKPSVQSSVQSSVQVSPSTPLLPQAGTVTPSVIKTSQASNLQRKVSFNHHDCNSGTSRTSVFPPPSNGVQSTVIKSYSIEKLRPRCHTCNPTGDTPYPLSEDTISYS